MSYGFSFNGKHSSSFNLKITDVKRPLLSDRRDQYIDVPGRHGSYYVGREFADKTITVVALLIAKDDAARQSTLRQIAGWLYSVDRQDLGFDDETGRTYRGQLAGAIEVVESIGHAQMTVTFRVDPIARGDEQSAGFAAGTASVTVDGTVATRPRFSVQLGGAATYVRISYGAQYVRVAGALSSGDVVVIDNEKNMVTVNGSPAMGLLDWQNSDFFEVGIGAATITLTSDAAISSAYVYWLPSWV